MSKLKVLSVYVEVDLMEEVLEQSKGLFKVEENSYTYLKPITKVSQHTKIENGFCSNGELVFDLQHNERYLEKTLISGDISYFFDRKIVKRGDEILHMPPGETELLVYLMERPKRVLSKEVIIEEFAERGQSLSPESITMRIQRIRQCLNDPYTKPKYIGTKIGLGYCWMQDTSVVYKLF
ncbi:MAG: response regulator transcription factor [Faecalicoccus sp.]|nr:response regulator transcription factor [Faecalicoccus sp.]